MKHLEGKWEIPQSCGCIVNTRTGKVEYCTLHGAAQEMLEFIASVNQIASDNPIRSAGTDYIEDKSHELMIKCLTIKNATS